MSDKCSWSEIACKHNRSWRLSVLKCMEWIYEPQKHAGWQIWYFPVDLTFSRNQPCASWANTHYSVSRKSMELPLLRLIGLRHNQIEHDNCVPVTFSVTWARPQGKDGERVHVCILLFLRRTNMFRWKSHWHCHAPGPLQMKSSSDNDQQFIL